MKYRVNVEIAKPAGKEYCYYYTYKSYVVEAAGKGEAKTLAEAKAREEHPGQQCEGYCVEVVP